MNKFKLFIENFLVYGLGGIISKAVPYLMLPIITRLMPNSYFYGLSDLSNTAVQFGTALAGMGMYDAVFRLFFEKDNEKYQKQVCSTALSFTFGTSFIIFVLMLLFRKPLGTFLFSDEKYFYILYLTAMSILIGGTNSIMQVPTRTQNQRRTFIVMNTISGILSYAIAIPLLLKGFYVIALPLSAVISALTIEVIFWILNREWFDFRLFDKSILKQLLFIGLPLLPNFLIYWIFNSSDRLMIGKLIGNSFTGVYSVGARIASVSQLIYTAFAGGWQYFAFSTMKEDGQVKSNSLVFEYLGVISFAAGILMCVFAHLIFKILFTGEYEAGYIVVPYLFLAPLMQMLYQVACNQFIVIKKTWPNAFILSVGAICNVLLNLTLIPIWGIEGAAFSTLIGYVISDIIVVIWLLKIKLMVISRRFIAVSLLMIGYFILWRLVLISNLFLSLFAGCIVIGIYIWLFKSDLQKILKKKESVEA
ncbi:oligosaccharide flippase family protein [uncultured Dubosiella sp.]|uniref:oligosaccharide flippase family protein n=1 Tax=uncultured Dubosiella sp. TaxID=1937011 RepID=UPI0025B42FB8|nr:oligosaccharide flippase family protein [uncultured Dubosiella sp.]